jgi:GAF domain-containing protein
MRWELGIDLFSEVVKKNTALNVENYKQELDKRGAKSILVTEKLRAWMGVPLTAGRRILGVIAVGKVKDTSPYNGEVFKIFSDIGSLAATSLDKANLFTQTRVRERQLTVLNDISRQLVATESDVEKLLEIIMNSSVDILNAEAGSLLLNSED